MCMPKKQYLDLVVVNQDAAAHGPLPLPVVLRRRKHRENLGPFAQGNPLRVRLVRAHDVAQIALFQEVVDGLGSEANGPSPPQALPEPCLPNSGFLEQHKTTEKLKIGCKRDRIVAVSISLEIQFWPWKAWCSSSHHPQKAQKKKT